MKKTFLTFCVLFASMVFSQEEKVYISSEDITVSKEGIFVRLGHEIVPVDAICYDYEVDHFYVKGGGKYRYIRCPTCKQNTYDVISGVCFNQQCNRVPDLNR